MSIPVTRTRITPPRRRPDLITRERLLESMDDLLEYKLFLISAPAGYGKTSLLVDLASQVEYPICWYSLDALDDDFQRFLAHFITAIQHQFPAFGKSSLSVLENSSPSQADRERLLRTIANDAFEHIDEHFALVLDDYHLVEDNEEINTFMNNLIQEMDENFHQIISSRTLLNLPDLPLMVGRSQVKGLSFEELAFRPDEIQRLMREKYHQTISDKQARHIAERTDGWITGLLLSAETMWKGLAGETRITHVSGVDLYDYLAQQVLDQQTPTMRSFLLRSSLLEEFNAPICEAVLGEPPEGETWGSMIGKVMQYNLFVQPLESEEAWLRYNHLFRDFLQERLSIERPEEKEGLLRKMIDVYADREEWEKAYAVCQRLGDDHRTAKVLITAGPSLMDKGRINTFARWADQLPEELIKEYPTVFARRGAIAIMLGNVKHGLEILETAEKSQRDKNDSELPRTLVWKATAYRFLVDYRKSIDLAKQAIQLIEDQQRFQKIKAVAYREIGIGFYQLGKVNEAIVPMEKSLQIYSSIGHINDEALVNMDIGLAHMNSGDYLKAQKHYQKAYTIWQKIENITQQANLLNNMGVLANLRGQYKQSKDYFVEALRFARESGYRRMEGFVLTSLGDLYADLEAYTAVSENYDLAKSIALEISDQYLLNYLEITQASLYGKLNKHLKAHHILDDIESNIKESGSSYENGLFNLERGKLFLFEGRSETAIKHLEKSIRKFEEGGQKVECAQAHLYLAQAFFDHDRTESAIHHIDKAFKSWTTNQGLHPLIHAGRDVKGILRHVKTKNHIYKQCSKLLIAIRDFEKELPALQQLIYTKDDDIKLFIPGISIQAFGRARVKRHGKVVSASEFTNQRAVRELFYFLLTHPDGLRKKAIGQALWPDSSPEELKRQFKNAIYRLRRALGKDIVLYDQGERRYRFNWGSDYRYDVEDFRSQLSRARNAESEEEKLAALEQAVSIYRHPYLPRVTRLWVEPIRNRLFRHYKDAVLTLGQLYLDNGEYQKTVNTCQRLLIIDPCQERAHRLSMQAHAAAGDRAAVARQYRSCVDALSRDLDTTPSPETETLYQRLME